MINFNKKKIVKLANVTFKLSSQTASSSPLEQPNHNELDD